MWLKFASALALASPFNQNGETVVTRTTTNGIQMTMETTQAFSTLKYYQTLTTSLVTPSTTKTTLETSNTPATLAGDYVNDILQAHNTHRVTHSAPGLTWSNDLASIAQSIAIKCVYGHDTATGGGGYGQNIGAGAPDSEVPSMISDQMYGNEVNLYPGYGKEPDMTNFAKWGHFSQIVWLATEEVGCYTQYCENGLSGTSGNISPYFTVCNYKPPGKYSHAHLRILKLTVAQEI